MVQHIQLVFHHKLLVELWRQLGQSLINSYLTFLYSPMWQKDSLAEDPLAMDVASVSPHALCHEICGADVIYLF